VSRGRGESLPVVAVGVAACAACCAPPVLAAVGVTVGLSAVAWLAGGLLAAAAVAFVGAMVIRRRGPLRRVRS
jgi:hypothetical protein